MKDEKVIALWLYVLAIFCVAFSIIFLSNINEQL